MKIVPEFGSSASLVLLAGFKVPKKGKISAFTPRNWPSYGFSPSSFWSRMHKGVSCEKREGKINGTEDKPSHLHSHV